MFPSFDLDALCDHLNQQKMVEVTLCNLQGS